MTYNKSTTSLIGLTLIAVLGYFLLTETVIAEKKTKHSAKEQAEIVGHLNGTILTRIRAGRDDLIISEPEPSQIDGYYQVTIAGAQKLYLSEDGEHFFSGDLYFLKESGIVNVTDMEMVDVRRETIAKVSVEDMIVYSPRNEVKGVLNVFTDVTCGYCRKLHGEMEQLNQLGIEVRYMAFPRSGVASKEQPSVAYNLLAQAWCSKNRATTLTKLKNGEVVDQALCDNTPVADQYKIGVNLGVTGTPAVFLSDGTLINGYRPAKEFAEALGIL